MLFYFYFLKGLNESSWYFNKLTTQFVFRIPDELAHIIKDDQAVTFNKNDGII